MPVDLGQSFPVGFAGAPPHMSAIDRVLWARFRRVHQLAFLRLYFDVGLGAGESPAGEVAANVRAAWQRLTVHRADVVGEGSNGWTIIEIRGAAGPGAIGSLVVYRDLWMADPPDGRPVALWLVTDVFPDNLRVSLQTHQISLFLV